MIMPFLNSTSTEQLRGNVSYLYLLYLMTAPLFPHPTKPTMPEFFAVAGHSVNLPCRGLETKPYDFATLIMWFRTESHTPIYTLDARTGQMKWAKHYPSANYSSRSFFNVSSQPPTLSIDPVLPSDDGVYKCQIEFKKSSTMYQKCRLYVITPPKEVVITDRTGQRVKGIIGPYNENSDINFMCEAIGGIPPPNVTWWRDSKLINASKISENNVTSQLYITNLQRRDLLVTYTCVASNNNMSIPETSSITIDLNLKPLDVRIISPEEILHADSKTTVVCESYGGRPKTQLTWWLGGTKITSNYKEDIFKNFTRNSLTLLPTPEDNGKRLLCSAMNPVFPRAALDYGWTIIVFYIPRVKLRFGEAIRPESIREGTDVYLECIVDANPHSEEVRWYFEGNVIYTNITIGIIQSNRTLVIQHIDKSWTGRYTCEASNSVGTTRSPEVMLRVKYVPSCHLKPSPIAIEIGKSAEVTCMADAYPAAFAFRWLFSGNKDKSISSSPVNASNSKISFIPTAEHLNGMVSCWAANAVSKQGMPCTTRMFQAAPPEPLNNCTASNISESSVWIDCQPPMYRGMNQTFHLEMYDSNLEHLILNITTNGTPSFFVPKMEASSTYVMVLYASNMKGRSSTVTVMANTSPLYKGMLSLQETKVGDGTSVTAQPVFFVPLSVVILILIAVLIVIFFHRKRRKKLKRNDPVTGATENNERDSENEQVLNTDGDETRRKGSNPDLVQNIPVLHNELKIEMEEERVELKYFFSKTKKRSNAEKKSKRISGISFTKRKRNGNLHLDKEERIL